MAWIDRHTAILFTAMGLVAFFALLYLGRNGSFFQDEWAFIRIGGLGSLRDWFAPHNEHWLTVPFGLYRALLLTVGMQSYLPYLATLLTMHAAAAAAIFVLLRRASGSFVALLGSGLFLVLGSGYQNLFWAFQIGFVGSTAAGLWALIALDRDRPRLAAVLFLISVASSTVGLPFLVAGFVELALDRRRWRQLVWLVAVAAAFIVWFFVIGREGLTNGSSSFAIAALLDLPRFVALGIASAFGSTFGLGSLPASLVVIAVVGAGAWLLARGQLPPRGVAAAVGLVALYLLIGLGRGQLGDAQVARSRYAYEAAAFVLVGLSAVIGRGADLLGDPIRIERPPDRRRALASVALGLLIVAIVVNGGVANVSQLGPGARFFREAAGELRATIVFADQYGADLPYDPPPVTRWSVPSPSLLATTTREWGTPARDVLLPSVIRRPTAVERDRALWRLVGGATQPRPIETPTGAPSVDLVLDDGPAAAAPTRGRPPTPVAFTGVRLIPIGDCMVMHAGGQAGTEGMTIVLEMDDGTSINVMTVGGGTGAVRLGREVLPDGLDQATVEFRDRSWAAVRVPRLGDASVFTLQLLFPTATTAAVACVD